MNETELDQLIPIVDNLTEIRKTNKELYPYVSQYLFDNSMKPDFLAWAVKYNLTFKTIRYPLYFGIEINQDPEYAGKQFQLYQEYKEALPILKKEEERLLQIIWEKLDGRKRYKWSLEEIAEACGKSPNYMFKYITRFDWFKPRNNLKGRKKHGRTKKSVVGMDAKI